MKFFFQGGGREGEGNIKWCEIFNGDNSHGQKSCCFGYLGKKQENFGKNLCFYLNFFCILVVLRLLR